VFICLPVSRLRYLAFVPMLALVWFARQLPDVPDLLIAQDGRTIAVSRAALYDEVPAPDIATNTFVTKANALASNSAADSNDNSGKLALLYPRRNKFVSNIWLRAYSGNKAAEMPQSPLPCDKDQCQVRLRGRLVSIIYDPKLLPEACKTADILLAPRLWWVNCRPRTPELVFVAKAKQQSAQARCCQNTTLRTGNPKPAKRPGANPVALRALQIRVAKRQKR